MEEAIDALIGECRDARMQAEWLLKETQELLCESASLLDIFAEREE